MVSLTCVLLPFALGIFLGALRGPMVERAMAVLVRRLGKNRHQRRRSHGFTSAPTVSIGQGRRLRRNRCNVILPAQVTTWPLVAVVVLTLPTLFAMLQCPAFPLVLCSVCLSITCWKAARPSPLAAFLSAVRLELVENNSEGECWWVAGRRWHGLSPAAGRQRCRQLHTAFQSDGSDRNPTDAKQLRMAVTELRCMCPEGLVVVYVTENESVRGVWFLTTPKANFAGLRGYDGATPAPSSCSTRCRVVQGSRVISRILCP